MTKLSPYEKAMRLAEEYKADCDKLRADLLNAKELLALATGGSEAATCTWREDEAGTWSTSCGELYAFTDGGPAENHAVFCHACGKQIEAVKYQEESESEE